MKALRAADVARVAAEKGAAFSGTDGRPLRPVDIAAIRARIGAPSNDATEAGLAKLTQAVSSQQDGQRALLAMLAELLSQMRSSGGGQEAKPIKKWDFHIERDDSEFKRMTRITATAIR